MFKYTSKDIVDRAEQLADLQNSDFISDKEKTALLNEAWISLYQKIVNADDKAFVKTISAFDGLLLPKDLYQLSALYVEKDRQQISKINPAQRSGYSISNNILHLSSDYDNVSVILEYFPTPKTIFYDSGKKETRNFLVEPKIIIDDDTFLGTDNNFYSYSSGNIIGTWAGAGQFLPLMAKNGYIILDDGELRFFNYSNTLIDRRQQMPFIIKGNEITYDLVKTNEDLSRYIAVFMDESEEILYFLNYDGYIYDKNFNRVSYAIDFYNSVVFCRNDGLYVYDGQQASVKRYLGDAVEKFTFGLYSFCCFVDETYCIVKDLSGKYFKMAYGFSTLFDYPNNIYYTILAYSLAISFKMKQQGDTAALTAKYDEAMAQFYDSISRDANQNYIIKDVYKNGRGRIWS